MIGSEDSDGQYFSPETGRYEDWSIQQLLFHELVHIAKNHRFSADNESEAIRLTNAFMTKYYGEPARDEDSRRTRLDGGTAEWEFNPNFSQDGKFIRAATQDPELLISTLSSLCQEEVEQFGPEVQSLCEFRSNRDAFVSQLRALAEGGNAEYLNVGLSGLAKSCKDNLPINLALSEPDPSVEVSLTSGPRL
jgi:hypothetical protein